MGRTRGDRVGLYLLRVRLSPARGPGTPPMRGPELEPEPGPGDGTLPSAAPGGSCGTARGSSAAAPAVFPGEGGGVGRGGPKHRPPQAGGESGVFRAPTAAALELLPVRREEERSGRRAGGSAAEPLSLPLRLFRRGGRCRGAAVPPWPFGPASPLGASISSQGTGGRGGRRSPWTCRGFASPRLPEASHKGRGYTDSPGAVACRGVSNAESPTEGFQLFPVFQAPQCSCTLRVCRGGSWSNSFVKGSPGFAGKTAC